MEFAITKSMETAASDYETSSFLKESTPSHLRLGSSNLPSPTPVIKENRKRLRSSSLMNEEVQKRMESLRSDLQAIAVNVLEQKSLLVSYASVFKSVELLCVHKHSEQGRLADFLFQAIDRQLSSWNIPYLQKEFDGSDNTDDYRAEIQHFVEDFQSWVKRLELLAQLFLFLDRSYLLHHPKKRTILEYGLNQFACRTIYQDSDKALILKKLQLLVTKIHYDCTSLSERKNGTFAGQKESQILFSCFFKIILRLDYQNVFLSQSGLSAIIGANYKQLKTVWLDRGKEYLNVVLDKLAAESLSLAGCGVPPEKVESILKTLKWNLIFSDFEEVLEMSLPFLLHQETYEYLKTLWKLCESAMVEAAFDACRSFTYIWGRLIQKQTHDIVDQSRNEPTTLIPNLFSLWERVGKTVRECFNVEPMVFETRSAQGKALGSKASSTFVLIQLSKYCDAFFKLFRKSKDKDVYPQFESEVLTVFKLLPNKIEFIALYERDLSKRMLLGKSFNFSIENKLVESILAVVGEGDETSNLLAMFRDMEKSRTLYGLTQLTCLAQAEFNPLVLEKKFWPEVPNPISAIALPESLGQALDEFTSKYHEQSEKHKFHKLDWSNYLLHQIILSVPFASGPKELSINLLQASVLMHFDESETLSISELLQRTKMDHRQLKKVLASLTTERYPILILREEQVGFNYLAEMKSNRVRIPMLREKETEMVDDASKVIQKSMNPSVRAAIVRIMKKEKQMVYPELLSKALEFVEAALVAIAKENIEYLISNEYLKRDVDGVTMTYIP